MCRDGRIKVNDEIINVCGKRLRGLSIEEAIKALKSPKKELDIVVARETNSSSSSQSNETSDFFNEDRLRDEHLRIAQKIHAYQNNSASSDFHETCSEVNLSSRPSSSSTHFYPYVFCQWRMKRNRKVIVKFNLFYSVIFLLAFLWKEQLLLLKEKLGGDIQRGIDQTFSFLDWQWVVHFNRFFGRFLVKLGES